MGSRLEQKSNLVRKRIENHDFEDEDGDEYEGSKFGGFPEYFRRKKIKLQNLDAQLRAGSDKPQIFKGVVCHVNGYTQPSLNDLHLMIVQHGGGFLQYLDGKTMATHIVAANLTPKKKEEFRRYRIVKPAWVVDSIKAEKLLPWDGYRVVDEGVGQKVLGFENGAMVSQANRKVQGYKEQTDASWYTSQLKARNGARSSRPSYNQTVTPDEDIEDDEYPMPEITSSIEQALDTAENAHARRPEPSSETLTTQQDLLQVVTELETPPPSSPPAPDQSADVNLKETASADTSGNVPGDTHLRPREGSQEPDYSMPVVRDSEKLRNISPSKLATMSAEEHNALLLSDPRIRKSTVVHPDFLDQYYRESRLHHLSTWKANLKSQLQALAAEKTFSQKSKLKRLPGQRRYIMHVDFDSFFAAVSLKKSPQYNAKPAVVAHGGGSGSEIASCNYPARRFGVSNGMWMKRAMDLCPDLKVLPYDFPGYEDASRKFYDAIMDSGGIVQSVSIDEALVDISAACIIAGGLDGVKRDEGAVHREQLRADEIAQGVRDEVFKKAGCAVSVGIGSNILLAKVALRKAKPAGQYQLKPEDVLEFIGKLEVQNLPGVAWSIGGKLEEIGIKLVKDIREVTRERLIGTLGPKTGEKIWDYARGIDRTEIGDQVIRKSVSAEVNWGVRFENQEQVDEFMQGLCGELHKRLVKEHVKGKQLTMKLMKRAANAPRDPPKHLGHGKCDTFNKSMQLGVATNDAISITKDAIALLKSCSISPGELRGIGVQMQKLEPIKLGQDGVAESSQRRLHFKMDPPPRPAGQGQAQANTADPIQDVKTPQKSRVSHFNQPSVPVESVGETIPTRQQLNVLGTQFVMPTQVDPSVLAELPEDIRAKLATHVKPPEPQPAITTKDQRSDSSSKPPSRLESAAVGLPSQSQLDLSILEALPEDVRAEVLGFYKSPSKRGGQAVLPQSPRKTRTLPPPPKQPVKRKRGGGSLFASRSRATAQDSDNATLTQANFVSRPTTRDNTPDLAAQQEPAELDPNFLAALPEDIRLEVLAHQRQTRLQRTRGIDTSLHQRPIPRHKRRPADEEAAADRVLALPPLPAKPTFTGRKLSALPDLRVAVTAWHAEFADEGPYEEDVAALRKYLGEVVVGERDVTKAVAVVEWFGWVVGESATREEVGEKWDDALVGVREGVQEALGERGLGRVEFA